MSFAPRSAAYKDAAPRPRPTLHRPLYPVAHDVPETTLEALSTQRTSLLDQTTASQRRVYHLEREKILALIPNWVPGPQPKRAPRRSQNASPYSSQPPQNTPTPSPSTPLLSLPSSTLLPQPMQPPTDPPRSAQIMHMIPHAPFQLTMRGTHAHRMALEGVRTTDRVPAYLSAFSCTSPAVPVAASLGVAPPRHHAACTPTVSPPLTQDALHLEQLLGDTPTGEDQDESMGSPPSCPT